MTMLVNDPDGFAAEALAGYVRANGDRVVAVPGGAVRATVSPPGQVAVVMGGGSGHFPAFAGWLGPGLVHGAACGKVFSSPSAAQVASVIRAAEAGGGVLLLPINYAGDILHFTEAAHQLRGEGADVRLVAVTDDIASGSPRERESRRGIAGSFLVAKIVGAAAAQGQTLDTVEQVAVRANEATRSFGVALSGCTLPGAAGPLFTVPAGRMAVGLGIHGEPGIDEVPLGTADNVADVLVDGLFAERSPATGQRVAVLVNGLGTVSPDELHLVFDRVATRLEQAGMVPVAPVVSELVTSLDMAGVSLSLTYLDQELERLWLAPADAAYFTRGPVADRRRRSIPATAPAGAPGDDEPTPPASESSRAVAAALTGHLDRVAGLLRTEQTRLGAIDAVAGDGDHGACMARGSAGAARAAHEAAERGAGAGTLLARAAAAWSDEAGGASGALWGAGLAAAAGVLGDQGSPSAETILAASHAFLDTIVSRGGAEVGDKTMVDAIVPFVAGLERSIGAGEPLAKAWAAAAAQASAAAEQTATFVARRGRSRTHGEHSLGTPDAGATSFALVVSVVAAS